MTTTPASPNQSPDPGRPQHGTDDDLLPYLRQALDLATANAEAGQLPFAAVVVRDGQVLGTGVNTAGRDSDPIAHAEVEAVRDACRKLGDGNLAGAVVVSSCEPCAMCHTAALVAGAARIVYAAPKEYVPDFDGTPRPDLTRLQGILRDAAPETVEHQPTPGAREPFERYLAVVASKGEGR
ncbi:nucleoside deaminase [Actinopolymorpha singaporensis]|uniref:Cytidine and deoxycytidylate deaminase zinc-binding region n=1 Tax=Actinopolymorpha singaporensis TaxID=117157 RepID=A0A1H1S599_9ACTN|nr:nucleoside deaminase [Actinopolymorpha singaporensis]SDS43073.1 Cytidine and deoxycytidylate deaminase zinc-binding region [Actinopolymorpha singaporensis]